MRCINLSFLFSLSEAASVEVLKQLQDDVDSDAGFEQMKIESM